MLCPWAKWAADGVGNGSNSNKKTVYTYVGADKATSQIFVEIMFTFYTNNAGSVDSEQR